MQRGDLYWARLAPRSGSEQKGRRPVVVISSDGFNQAPGWRSIIVIPVTTSGRQAGRGPTVVPLEDEQAELSPGSVAICHQITTLDRAKLEKRIGTLSTESLQRIENGLAAAYDLTVL